MKYGDYLIKTNRTILIERKTPSDFINSTNATMRDPATKIARQLNGCLAEDVDEVVLLIDGMYYAIKGGRMRVGKQVVQHSVGAFNSKLRTIQNHGIRVEWNPSDWYLPQHLLSMYKYAERDDHSTLSLAPKSFAIPARKDVKWVVLMGIKGVGPVMAQNLLNHFGSIKNIANANLKDLREIKGVGQVTGEQILWHLT